MASEIEQLNSLDNFFNNDDLSISLKIKRDLFNYLQTKIGKGLFSRNSGGLLNKFENEANSELEDIIYKSQIVQSVGEYNMSCPTELRAIVGSDMVAIKRQGNRVQILVVFVPMQNPSVEALNNVVVNVPSVGG